MGRQAKILTDKEREGREENQREKMREWRNKNRDYLREYHHQYYLDHREQMIASIEASRRKRMEERGPVKRGRPRKTDL